MDRSAIKAWRWGLVLTVPSTIWLADWVVVRYGGPLAYRLIPFLRPFSRLGLVAAVATPLTVPIVMAILLWYRRMGIARWLCLLTGLLCSIAAGALTWWGILLLVTWHS